MDLLLGPYKKVVVSTSKRREIVFLLPCLLPAFTLLTRCLALLPAYKIKSETLSM